MFDYLFFDLDGTLTNPAQGITNSFIYAFKSLGIEVPTYETLLTFIGPPLPVTFGKMMGLPDSQVDEAIKKYREYFSTRGIFENELFDDIPPALEKLKAAGKKLVVATSKPEEYSVKIINHFGLEKYFDYVCGSCMDETRGSKTEIISYALERCGIGDISCSKGRGNNSSSSNNNDNKSRVLMIGDRFHDIEGAKNNQIKSCGVLYGFGSQEELKKAGADYIIPKIDGLFKIV